jgi:ABC-type glycerol-3-phosphate transport system permease component
VATRVETSTRRSTVRPAVTTPRVVRARFRRLVLHLLLLLVGLGMVYPLLWMISSSLKPDSEIFTDGSLIPRTLELSNYTDGWTALGTSFTTFYVNSFLLCALCVLGNVVSCVACAYALARLRFPLRRIWFGVMLVGVMLPFHVTLVPQYVIFSKLGWVGTILPIVVPKFLASDAFFVFLLVQFIRSIPVELDESAKIDGCGPYSIFFRIVLPLTKPALATVAIFTFLFTWNDFFTQLLYLGNAPDQYTIPVALGAFIDSTSGSSYGPMLAMSVLSLIPVVGFFIAFQRLLVEGIATTGLKG